MFVLLHKKEKKHASTHKRHFALHISINSFQISLCFLSASQAYSHVNCGSSTPGESQLTRFLMHRSFPMKSTCLFACYSQTSSDIDLWVKSFGCLFLLSSYRNVLTLLQSHSLLQVRNSQSSLLVCTIPPLVNATRTN